MFNLDDILEVAFQGFNDLFWERFVKEYDGISILVDPDSTDFERRSRGLVKFF